ncbi:MAG: hypothetical protein AAF360_00120 [Pseudomonadota bacterium]
MRVRVREATVNGRPLEVFNPRRGRNFPRDEPIKLTEHELADARIRRLLPPARAGGVSGGRDGDLVPMTEAEAKALIAAKASKPPARAKATAGAASQEEG